MNKKKRYILNIFVCIFLSVLFFSPKLSYGKDINTLEQSKNNTGNNINCEENNITIQGPYDIKKGVSSYFFISKNGEKENLKTDFSIFFQGKPIYTNTSFSGEMRYSFEKIGNYEIKANVYKLGCIYKKNSIIRVYKDIILYIGSFLQDFNFGLLDNIQQNDFLLSTIILDKTEGKETNIEENIQKKTKYISQIDYIFLNNPSLSTNFDIVEKIQTVSKDFNGKKIFIITHNDEDLTKKFISSKIHKQNLNNIYIINYKNFWDSVISLSIDNPDFKLLKRQKPVITEVEEQKRSFGGLIDMLIFYGINIKFIELLFISIISILVIVFLKQVVGLPGYGLYFPILASFSLFYIPIHFFVFLLIFSFVSHYITKFITDKIVLLIYAKIGLYISIYTIVSILGFMIYFLLPDNIIDPITFSSEVFISWFLLGVIGKKVVGEIKNFKNGLFHIIRFSSLVWIVFKLFNISKLQHFVLLNPSIIFVCILLIILLGRYTGLMFTEYIRFWPFIKKKILKK